MNRFFFLCALLLSPLRAAAGNGDWRVYAAYHDAQRTVALHGVVYVLSDGGLYSYDPEDTSVETYDRSNALSDNGIRTILPCAATGELVVVYDNGNIDLLPPDGAAFNLSDLKQKPLADKTINDVTEDGGTVYVSTASGIVCVDVARRVFGNFYAFGPSVLSAVRFGNHIYAMTPRGAYAGDVADNLLDPGQWKLLRAFTYGKRLITDGKHLYMSTADGAFVVNDTERFTWARCSSAKYTDWTIDGGTLYAFKSQIDRIEGTACTTVANSGGIGFAAFSGSNVWAACGAGGLRGYKLADNALTAAVSSVVPDSPVRNYSYKLSLPSAGRLLVAGGNFYYPETNYAGTAMMYENGTWTNFDEEKVAAQVGADYYRNVTDIVQDPADPARHWLGTKRSGIYEFRNGEYAAHYTHTNSPLASILPDAPTAGYYVRVTGLAFDSGNNLWMANNQTDTVVHVLKPDGTWKSLYFDEIAGYPTFDHIVFDSRGWMWTNARRSTASHKAGFFVLDYNGTLDNTADDRHVLRSEFRNQDGTSYTPTLFHCIREDLDGAMWFGCERGLFVSYDPASVFGDNFYLTQVKVPRTDDPTLADYLLSEVPVKCIAVDGGNRKWIGTSGSGVFLVSADGKETVHHFTAANSPLVSDEINDIAIDGATGEVFIATDKGLVSYHGDATDPVPAFDKDLVKVYPNPVRPDHQGAIVVTGLMYNSNVKIVNAAGRLVNEGTSVGGEYTWDGRTTSGRRCANGVYYVLATDEEGGSGVVAKFLVVRE